MISEAFAQAPGAAPAGDGMMSILMLVGFILIMWLLVIRPQNKRYKEHQAVVSGLKRGDEIVMESGVCGKITKVIDESYMEVEVAEGVKIKCVRNAVSVVLNAEKK